MTLRRALGTALGVFAAWACLASAVPAADCGAAPDPARARALVEQGAARMAAGDLAGAREVFGRAARADLPDACHVYGVMLLNGQGGEADPTEAQKWIVRAARAGNASARVLLATLYLDGRGLPADPSWAYYWAGLARDARDLPPRERATADRTFQAASKGLTPGGRAALDASLARAAAP